MPTYLHLQCALVELFKLSVTHGSQKRALSKKEQKNPFQPIYRKLQDNCKNVSLSGAEGFLRKNTFTHYRGLENQGPFRKWTFPHSRSGAKNKNLRPLFITNILPISENYGLRNLATGN